MKYASLLLLPLLWGCHGEQWHPSCRSDADCEAGEVCFPDGCGDPGQNLAAEVTPNSWGGHHAQDLPIPALRPDQDLILAPPSRILGLVLRSDGSPDAVPAPYAASFRVAAQGESPVLPGILRRFELSGSSVDGSFTLPVSPGSYALTVTPDDVTIPSVAMPGQKLDPGADLPLSLLLESALDLLRVDGRVLKKISTNQAVIETAVEIQALEEGSLAPLSQRGPVSSGEVTSTGNFTLFLPARAQELGKFVLRVSPKEAGAPVPSRDFLVNLSSLPTALEMGDYGSPVPVSGVALDGQGHPVISATVYLSGSVSGGTYRSPSVLTDGQGQFSLQTLPSPNLDLWVVPPAQAPAGILRTSVSPSGSGTALGSLHCPDRPQVTGRLLLPNGMNPASQVQVLAERLGEVKSQEPMAAAAVNPASIFTNVEGDFGLRLDPGLYRLDFVPPDPLLPRVSRFVRVNPDQSLLLGEIALSLGRTVRGRVSSRGDDPLNPEALKAQPFAAVRFYRVVKVEEVPTSVLLAEAISDPSGDYTLVLPTR